MLQASDEELQRLGLVVADANAEDDTLLIGRGGSVATCHGQLLSLPLAVQHLEYCGS